MGNFGLYSSWESSNDNVSYDIDHKKGWSTRLSFSGQNRSFWEIYYASSDVVLSPLTSPSLNFNLSTLHLGASRLFDNRESKARTLQDYYGASVGLTRFSPNNFSGQLSDDFSFSLFSGIKGELSDNLFFTLEGRVLVVVLDSATTLTCKGSCNFVIKSELWTHLQFQAGLTFRF